MTIMKTPKGTELPLIDYKGKPYLQVAHRLVWFREEQPHFGIETEIIRTSELETLAKATIKDGLGVILATSHKTETKQDFKDHLEKAETGAVGRALAMCGYGTQFAPELIEGERLADSPVTPVKFNGKNKPDPSVINNAVAVVYGSGGPKISYVKDKTWPAYGSADPTSCPHLWQRPSKKKDGSIDELFNYCHACKKGKIPNVG